MAAAMAEELVARLGVPEVVSRKAPAGQATRPSVQQAPVGQPDTTAEAEPPRGRTVTPHWESKVDAAISETQRHETAARSRTARASRLPSQDDWASRVDAAYADAPRRPLPERPSPPPAVSDTPTKAEWAARVDAAFARPRRSVTPDQSPPAGPAAGADSEWAARVDAVFYEPGSTPPRKPPATEREPSSTAPMCRISFKRPQTPPNFNSSPIFSTFRARKR
jgi:hypothetical protein